MAERKAPNVDRVREELAGERNPAGRSGHEDLQLERFTESVERVEGGPSTAPSETAASEPEPTEGPPDEESTGKGAQTIGEADRAGVDVAGESEPHNPVSPA